MVAGVYSKYSPSAWGCLRLLPNALNPMLLKGQNGTSGDTKICPMSEHAKVFWCGWRHTRTLWAFKKDYGTMRPSNNLSEIIPGIHWQWFPDVSVFKFPGNWKLVVLVLISENKILLRMQPSAPYYSRNSTHILSIMLNDEEKIKIERLKAS